MDQSDEQSNYTISSCQHCGGHIKFDSSQLRKGETRTVECPHCHLDTILFVRDGRTAPSNPKAEKIIPRKDYSNERAGSATIFELFVLQLTRRSILIAAALVIVALVVIALVFIWTFLPKAEPQPRISPVSYEEIAVALQPQSTADPSYQSYGNQINTSEAVPAMVANFIANHPNFKLDTTWMSSDLRRAFLSNLADIIQKAKTSHASDDKLIEIVTTYINIWTTENTPKPEPAPLYSNAEIRSFCVEAALALFITITGLCLILVLLAIERNIRLIAEKVSVPQNNPKKG